MKAFSPTVLWHCWLGHPTSKNAAPEICSRCFLAAGVSWCR